MSSANSSAVSVSPLRLRPAAIDFVNTRLPRYHSVFEHPDAEYDENTNRFVRKIQDEAPGSDPGRMALRVRPNPVPTATLNATKAQALQATMGLLQTVPLRYPPQLAPRQLPPEVADMKFWEPIWPKAMAHLQQTAGATGRIEKGFGIREASAWKDVTTVLDRARKKYEGFAHDGMFHRALGRIRRGGRRAADTFASPLQQIIKVVPNHPIATPVLGAVNLLMNAWKEVAKVRKELADSFDESTMASLFADIELYSDMYPDDQNITNASVELLVTILKAAEGAIGFYTMSRLGRATFEGEEYLKTFRESLKNIKNDGDKLERAMAKDTANQIAKLSLLSLESCNLVVSLFMDHEKEKNINASHRRNDLSVSEAVSIYTMESRGATPQPENLPDPDRTCTLQTLLDILDSTDLDEQDMDIVIDRAAVFPEADSGRAEQVVSTSVFRDWVVYKGSSRLLIYGDHGDNDYPEISPLSALCVTLVKALRTRPNFVSLVFFCGRHLGRGHDENTGTSGLMRSFIVQLLRQCPSAYPDTLDLQASLSEIENDNLEYLTNLFAGLVRQLPTSTTLVVMIDGVLVYERQEHREGLYEVIDMLTELAEDEELLHNPVKILLTSPTQTRTKKLHETFRGKNGILSMGSMHNTGQGPSRSGVTRKITELSNTSEEEESSSSSE
ncbi:hypothetical protein F5Y14DRAFT_457230 [Nemania sp. NC0429]|nr:hypothetical protein F5Y14DRAFT_457230 [Nemania sp. NC0429]